MGNFVMKVWGAEDLAAASSRMFIASALTSIKAACCETLKIGFSGRNP